MARTSASASRYSIGVRSRRLLADAGLVPAEVERQAARLSVDAAPSPSVGRDRGGADDPLRAPHDRGDSRQQLRAPERLDEVVVGADPERPDLGLLGALAGDDDDRRVALGADPARDGEAVRSGHRQVQQHDVRPLLAVAADGGQPVVCGDDLVALGARRAR